MLANRLQLQLQLQLQQSLRLQLAQLCLMLRLRPPLLGFLRGDLCRLRLRGGGRSLLVTLPNRRTPGLPELVNKVSLQHGGHLRVPLLARPLARGTPGHRPRRVDRRDAQARPRPRVLKQHGHYVPVAEKSRDAQRRVAVALRQTAGSRSVAEVEATRGLERTQTLGRSARWRTQERGGLARTFCTSGDTWASVRTSSISLFAAAIHIALTSPRNVRRPAISVSIWSIADRPVSPAVACRCRAAASLDSLGAGRPPRGAAGATGSRGFGGEKFSEYIVGRRLGGAGATARALISLAGCPLRPDEAAASRAVSSDSPQRRLALAVLFPLCLRAAGKASSAHPAGRPRVFYYS